MEALLRWSLVGVAGLFILFLVLKSRFSLRAGGRGPRGGGRARLLEARRVARAALESPGDPECLEAAIRTLRETRRHRTLERILWRSLAEGEGPVQQRALSELISLYGGPLRRPIRARALERLRRP
ncbi:MAG: hypothetical protein KC416_16095 [Myxococcales bacterium]|nr:hypothetical protein [Myxococcales bacterium]